MRQELIDALESNGIIVECESPLEIYREDLGRATGEFALFIAQECYESEKWLIMNNLNKKLRHPDL